MWRDVLSFVHPRRVAVCQRRRVRKQVLFANKVLVKGKGKGGRRFRRPRWTEKSYIRCK